MADDTISNGKPDEGLRDSKGHFRKGCTGNARGRPPKPTRVFTDDQLYDDILNVMEEETVIVVNGKRYKVPSIIVVYRQLVRKGVSGDVRCMCKAIDLRQQILSLYTARLSELADFAARANRAYRERPEDFTDADLETLREIGRRVSDPYHVNRSLNNERTRKH